MTAISGSRSPCPRTDQSDDYESVDVEPVEEWAPLQSGDTEGVHWTIYRARANPNLDGTPNACYTVEVGPSSGPVIPTTTITYPGDRSLRGLTMSCQSDIGPKPKRRASVALLGSVRLWQPMQMLGEDISNESYVWIAGLVAPEVDHVRIEGVDVPVVEHTFLWLSRDGDLRPKQVELLR